MTSKKSSRTSKSTTPSSPGSRAKRSSAGRKRPGTGDSSSARAQAGSGTDGEVLSLPRTHRCVLGIDPGTRCTGYALLESREGRLSYREIDTIVLPSHWSLARRLGRLGLEMNRILAEHRPDEISVEQAIYAQNVRTALALGQARGVILFSSISIGLEVHEYSPREVKRAVTGSGNASKSQVQGMIQRLLQLDRAPASDAADAAAIALCHLLRPVALAGAEAEGRAEGSGAAAPSSRTARSRRKSSRWTEEDVLRLRTEGRTR